MTTPVEITKEEAAAAIRAAAQRIEDPDLQDFGRILIHTYRGTIGADWDLDAAIRSVSKARRCAWVNTLTRHELGVLEADGCAVFFDCQRPVDAG